MINESPISSNIETPAFLHIPVLGKEIIAGLAIRSNGHYLDTTVGGGGHSRLILDAAPDTKITAIDQDEDALTAAKNNLAKYGNRVEFVHSNFAFYEFPRNTFDGIIADLGVSSYHLDNPERGFSFRHEAELDMRMDRSQLLTAAEAINHWDEEELANIFFKYGEERLSRRIARRIVEKRPFHTTTELAETISYCVPRKYRYGRIHPATRVFQGLRIAINDELKSLETLLEKAPDALVEGGKIAIISFHSLEDRIVKHAFKDSPSLKVLTKKPIIAQEEEISTNPRSRSAKLRIAELVSSEQ
ncbi:16S rRNA (cytosine(1402)-N(4))-methyltransferase RsmH [Rivularia sp. UHCC 0363]|uniref:16S rRNA (cytosine(1402)-N(4))-methyltransferase RsmH n=1 Tax=Rivularia sp. UHCC 0363 TaxID=3110244 RepID=UPI002B1FFF05|nr:16S rRNA (cytosine(1402)-N(4))-methyltransferase RsmH [Rivularia sp. UHCC 0363]MEA5596142.1 16S rRNA (cytosine(1402)-N(4))-methyltransferase RsmH [Rivularia sp. UHCC 0363]